MSALLRGEEAAEVAAVADSFAAAHLTDGNRPLPALVDAGLWNLGIPTEYGGQGADDAVTLGVIGRLARVSATAAVSVVHTHAAAHGLLRLRAYDRAEACASGVPAVVAWTNNRTRANRVDMGLNPTHILLSLGTTTALLPADRLTVETTHVLSGLNQLGTAALSLPPDMEWTEAPEAVAVMTRWWVLGVAACAVGVAATATMRAGAYVAQRQQFGGPLAELPAIATAVDRLSTTVIAMDSELARRLGQPAVPGPDGLLARRVCSAAVRVCLDAIQLHGGYGYLAEYGVEGLARDAMSLRAACAVGGPYLPSVAESVGGLR